MINANGLKSPTEDKDKLIKTEIKQQNEQRYTRQM